MATEVPAPQTTHLQDFLWPLGFAIMLSFVWGWMEARLGGLRALTDRTALRLLVPDPTVLVRARGSRLQILYGHGRARLTLL
jgi:hypothetical protein